MTDEAKALVERLREVSSVLFDDYGDGTHAVEDYALPGKAADLIETQAREIERLREALREIAERHIPDQPAAFGGDELDWAVRQHTALRASARAALAGDSHDQ